MTAERFFNLLHKGYAYKNQQEKEEFYRQLESYRKREAAKRAVRTKRAKYPKWPDRNKNKQMEFEDAKTNT